MYATVFAVGFALIMTRLYNPAHPTEPLSEFVGDFGWEFVLMISIVLAELYLAVNSVYQYWRFRNIRRVLELTSTELTYTWPGYWRLRGQSWPRSAVRSINLKRRSDFFGLRQHACLIINSPTRRIRRLRLRTEDPELPDKIVGELRRILYLSQRREESPA
jgi:hypothetical protein